MQQAAFVNVAFSIQLRICKLFTGFNLFSPNNPPEAFIFRPIFVSTPACKRDYWFCLTVSLASHAPNMSKKHISLSYLGALEDETNL